MVMGPVTAIRLTAMATGPVSATPRIVTLRPIPPTATRLMAMAPVTATRLTAMVMAPVLSAVVSMPPPLGVVGAKSGLRIVVVVLTFACSEREQSALASTPRNKAGFQGSSRCFSIIASPQFVRLVIATLFLPRGVPRMQF
jgi:hypothetical protein